MKADVWMIVDVNENYAIAADENDIDEAARDANLINPTRMVKFTIDVPAPTVVEVLATVPAEAGVVNVMAEVGRRGRTK